MYSNIIQVIYDNFIANIMWCPVLSCPVVSDSMECSLPGYPVHGILQANNTGVDFHFLLQGNLPNPGIKHWSPALQTDSLPTELPTKSLNHSRTPWILMQWHTFIGAFKQKHSLLCFFCFFVLLSVVYLSKGK